MAASPVVERGKKKKATCIFLWRFNQDNCTELWIGDWTTPLSGNMAAGSSRVAGAAVSPISKQMGRPPDHQTLCGSWVPWRCYSHFRVKEFSCLLKLMLFLTIITAVQLWGNCLAGKCSALLAYSQGGCAVNWGQYIIYSKVLDDGRVRDQRLQREDRESL